MQPQTLFFFSKVGNNSSHNPHKSPLVKSRFLYIVQDMKISKLLLAPICTLLILPSFGQTQTEKDKELFEFSVAAPAVEAPKVAEVTKVVEKKEELKLETKEGAVPAPAALVADAQTLIKDKLVQKYQVRLDDVIGRMTSRLSAVSADEQRAALTDLRDRMAEKKTTVVGMKDLEPLKKDIIIAILDHVVYRLEGLIKQSAQTTTTKSQA
jgi:hypothetical protein